MHKPICLPDYLPAPTQPFPWKSSFLMYPYLPETYFPHLKRPLLYRPFNPDIDGQPCLTKRQRTCSSPLEHRNLCELKRHERENEKFLKKSGACINHGSVITMPIKVMRYIQQQEGTINKLQQGQEGLMEQIADLSKMLKNAIENFGEGISKQKKAKGTGNITLNSSQFESLRTYHAFIKQMLKNFRGMQFSDGSSRSLNLGKASFSFAVSLPNPVILSTFECAKQIRDLILFQCHFDCDEELALGLDDDKVQINFEFVFNCLLRMERNMTEFMKRSVVRDHGSDPFPFTEETWTIPSTLRSLPSIDTTPIPVHFSTPAKKTSSNICSRNTGKRQPESTVAEVEKEWKSLVNDNQNRHQSYQPVEQNAFARYHQDQLEVKRRKKLTPKRVTFAFLPEETSMEVD